MKPSLIVRPIVHTQDHTNKDNTD